MPAANKKKVAPPAIQVIGSRVRITLDEGRGRESLTFQTPHGHTVTLRDGDASIRIESSNGDKLRLDPAGITIEAAAKVTINAAEVKVNAANARFSGVVQCDTLISNSVVSSSYTPGAGNIV